MSSAPSLFAGRRTARLLLFLLIFFRPPVHAQNAVGRIIGTVTDTQGAVMAGTQITVVNTGTAIAQKTTTSGQGFYQVLDLPDGTDTVSTERSGFAREATPPQSLDINQSLRVDIHMQGGSVS